MDIVQLTGIDSVEAANQAANVLRSGGVILYPTDTLYGLGADAFSDDAVAKVYAIKGRDGKKPIHCIVSDLAMAEKFAEVNDAAQKLATRFLPGPLTLVLQKNASFVAGIARDIATIGIRIPRNEFCIALAKAFGAPYTATSANAAGAPNVFSVAAVLEQLGGRADMIELAVDAGTLPERKPSTVVDVSSGSAEVLREGAIAARDILEVAGA